jgi:hypothetical protein
MGVRGIPLLIVPLDMAGWGSCFPGPKSGTWATQPSLTRAVDIALAAA